MGAAVLGCASFDDLNDHPVAGVSAVSRLVPSLHPLQERRTTRYVSEQFQGSILGIMQIFC